MSDTRRLIENAADTTAVINGHTLEQWVNVAVRPGNCGQLDAVLRQHYLHETIDNPTTLQRHFIDMLTDSGANIVSPNTDDTHHTLAVVVRNRRSELKLSRADVQARGGPSQLTLARIENTEYGGHAIRPGTMRKIDHALQWAPGSTARVLQGGQPNTAPHEVPAHTGIAQHRVMGARLEPDRKAFFVETTVVEQLLTGAQQAWASQHDPTTGQPYSDTTGLVETLQEIAQEYLGSVRQHTNGLEGVIAAAGLTGPTSAALYPKT